MGCPQCVARFNAKMGIKEVGQGANQTPEPTEQTEPDLNPHSVWKKVIYFLDLALLQSSSSSVHCPLKSSND
jgi:hypothetical protein